jgi:hypothetical protein
MFLLSNASCWRSRTLLPQDRPENIRSFRALAGGHFEQVNFSSMQRDIDSSVCAGGAVRPHCLPGLAPSRETNFASRVLSFGERSRCAAQLQQNDQRW